MNLTIGKKMALMITGFVAITVVLAVIVYRSNNTFSEALTMMEQRQEQINEINEMKYMFGYKRGVVISEQATGDAQTNTVKIMLKSEGWSKIPQDLLPSGAPTPRCYYSGYFLSFQHNGVFYDIDMHGLVSGVRGDESDETDFNTLHNMLLKEGIVDGEFQCGINESLISPMEYEGKTYIQYIDGVPATEKLTNVKPGDKTIWGVVVPTVIFLILFAVPYLDPGPSRLAKNRRVGVTVGILTTIVIVVLSFMGTGLWGVAAPPAVELIQEHIPEEGVGPVREIPYDELFVGEYDTSNPSSWPGGELGVVVAELAEAVHRESEKPDNNFFEGNVVVKIEQWTPVLKKLTMTVNWLEVPEGSTTGELVENSLSKTFYFHESSNYSLLE